MIPNAAARFHPNDKSSEAMFWRSHDKVAGLNNAFMEMMQGPNPLTPEDVRRLIDKHPDRYGRFEGFATPKTIAPGIATCPD